jgi:hypothetical protein
VESGYSTLVKELRSYVRRDPGVSRSGGGECKGVQWKEREREASA